MRALAPTRTSRISIHPPRAGRDQIGSPAGWQRWHFNPPAPCGAGPAIRSSPHCLAIISIHPPRAGRDSKGFRAGVQAFHFNPPAPCGAGRPQAKVVTSKGRISIHPPRAGRDSRSALYTRLAAYFNPPAPCGAGPSNPAYFATSCRFQSTRPVRGGTAIMHKIYPMHSCIIHNTTCS